MHVFICLILILVSIYLFLPNNPYISSSKIDRSGLFSGKNYKKGDIIIDDLFPYKEKNTMLFNPIGKEKFQEYILEEGKYMNHCSINYNIDVLTDNYRKFYVVATRDIKKHEELTADYNNIHKYYPFIAPALSSYKTC